ncbi:amidase [Roseovarius pacificus]|uniref:amidase n=1 Tax=Roseovarius pacificus TaxID=337701 RepID=UPI002A187218|nr:amidase [Roseovarius pacificus]
MTTSATAAATAIRNGTLSSESLVREYLARIAERDEPIQAWAHLDPERTLEQARAADRMVRDGKRLGALHGVPVAIKDIIDTKDMPTACGSPILEGRRPAEDATVTSLLRRAGAVVLGKTVTTEFALSHPGRTRNPRDPDRTPGGSSSGSAAAVAAGMVPLALGTQTQGSVIRPAAFCGIYGFKPSRGRISRRGVRLICERFDTVGVFANDLADTALLAEVLMAYDDLDPAMRRRPRPKLAEAADAGMTRPPRIAFVRTPVWTKADPETRIAFDNLAARLSPPAQHAALSELFDSMHDWHATIMNVDAAVNLAAEYGRAKERMSDDLRNRIAWGMRCPAVDYSRAVAGANALGRQAARLFRKFDAVLTPAAPGVAPLGLESTGSPIFCTLASHCGLPALSLPLLNGEDGLPLGVQIVGPRDGDAALFRVARWLLDQHIAPNGQSR